MFGFNRGHFFLTLAQLAVANSVIMGKYMGSKVPVFVYQTMRFAVCAAVLASVMIVARKGFLASSHPKGRLTKGDWLLMVGQGVTAGFLFNILFFTGLQHTNAISAGIIGGTFPGVLALLAFFVLKERLGYVKIFSIVLAMIGIFVLNLDNGFEDIGTRESYFGDFLVFLAMIPEAYYSILGRQLNGRVSLFGAAFVATLTTVVMLFPMMIGDWKSCLAILQSPQLLALTVFGGVVTVAFYVSWSQGLVYVPAASAAIFGSVMPVATTLLAVLFLGEHFGWTEFLGLSFVLISILVGVYEPGWKRKRQLGLQSRA